MDKRYERLRENCEDALLALLMERAAREEGGRLVGENERLRGDSAAALPESLDRRSERTIRRAFARRRARRGARMLGRLARRVSALAAAASLLLVMAYAVSPQVRETVWELTMEYSRSGVSLRFTEGDAAAGQPLYEGQLACGYALPAYFDGCLLASAGGGGSLSSFLCIERGSLSTDENGDLISVEGIMLTVADIGEMHAHIPEGGTVRELTVNGSPGVAVLSEGGNVLIFGDEERGLFVELMSRRGLDTLREAAEGLRWVGEAAEPEKALGYMLPKLPPFAGGWKLVSYLDDGEQAAYLEYRCGDAMVSFYLGADPETMLLSEQNTAYDADVEVSGTAARLHEGGGYTWLDWTDAAGRGIHLMSRGIGADRLLRLASGLR